MTRTRKRRAARSRSAARRPFHVYVVERDPEGLYNVGAGAVYVGETQLRPEERLAKHLAGGRTAAGVVTRRGLRLRPDLAPPEGPFETRNEALRYEKKTANRLRHRGYRVFGGEGKRFMQRRALAGTKPTVSGTS